MSHIRRHSSEIAFQHLEDAVALLDNKYGEGFSLKNPEFVKTLVIAASTAESITGISDVLFSISETLTLGR